MAGTGIHLETFFHNQLQGCEHCKVDPCIHFWFTSEHFAQQDLHFGEDFQQLINTKILDVFQ